MIWSWLHRRPHVADFLLAAALWLPTVAIATRGPHPVACVLFVTLGTVPLLRRREAPLTAVLVSAAAAVAVFALGSGLPPFQLAVSLYTLATSATAPARRSVGLGAIGVVAVALTIANGDEELGSTAFHVVFLVAAWLLGDAIGTRRAYVRELELKAERLERERVSEARRVVAEEQTRIARELHDVIAHALSVIVVQAGAAEEVYELDPALARAPIRAIDAAARTALADLRRVLGVLKEDAAYDPQPGLAGLDGLIDQVRATGLDVALEIEGPRHRLPATVDLSAFRIIQEALTNTLKHAHASHARVSVRYGNDLRLQIRDDGRGDGAAAHPGNGLAGMRERAAMLGGRVETRSPATGGYLVTARIPLGDRA
ncbi:MAG TPA: sensor histidine kinase [Gaiellaceae bacterium]